MLVKVVEAKKFREFNFKIAIIQSLFNSDVTDGLLKGALDYCFQKGEHDNLVTVYKVPGAFEIPFVARKLVKREEFEGILALGAIIRGETGHFKFISNATFIALQQVQLKSKIPISLGILTTFNKKQALDRITNTNNKGAEAMASLHDMIEFNQSKSDDGISQKKQWKTGKGFASDQEDSFLRL